MKPHEPRPEDKPRLSTATMRTERDWREELENCEMCGWPAGMCHCPIEPDETDEPDITP